MTTFDCIVRTKDGAKQHIFIEANDRKNCLDKLKSLSLVCVCINDTNKLKIKKCKHDVKTNVDIKPTKPLHQQEASTKTIDQYDKQTLNNAHHAYIIGFVFSILGILVSSMVWRKIGLQYSLKGCFMNIVAMLLWVYFGSIGLLIGIGFAIYIEYDKFLKNKNS